MELLHELTTIGLTPAEAKIYETVLRLGTCSVKGIAKESGFHRTNIYDVLEQLKEKGFITDHKEGKAMRYRAADPQNLEAYLQEKQDLLKEIIPQLKALHEQDQEPVRVEVFKGPEGMKSAFRDILKTKQTLYAFGVKGQLREKLPIFAQQWYRKAKKTSIKYQAIYTTRNPPDMPADVRYVSEEFSGPVATFIYGEKININIWEPSIVAIVITSQLVANMYKKHFDLLWKIAKK